MPLELKEADDTTPEWPSSIFKHSPDCTSHILTVLSKLDETTRVPKELKAADDTAFL